MGIFSSIKELFNKNIECDADMNSHMVFLLKKKKYMYLNKNIIVRDGTQCVVVYKSRVADVILPGKYKITEQVIPETYRRAKVDKLNNKREKFKLTASDWMNWYDVLDLKYGYSEDPDVFDPFANEDIFYETISKEIPDALQKYTEGEIKDIYKYNMTNDYYDDPIYSIQEIEIS